MVLTFKHTEYTIQWLSTKIGLDCGLYTVRTLCLWHKSATAAAVAACGAICLSLLEYKYSDRKTPYTSVASPVAEFPGRLPSAWSPLLTGVASRLSSRLRSDSLCRRSNVSWRSCSCRSYTTWYYTACNRTRGWHGKILFTHPHHFIPLPIATTIIPVPTPFPPTPSPSSSTSPPICLYSVIIFVLLPNCFHFFPAMHIIFMHFVFCMLFLFCNKNSLTSQQMGAQLHNYHSSESETNMHVDQCSSSHNSARD